MQPFFEDNFYIPKSLISEDQIKQDLRVIGRGRDDAPMPVDCFKSEGDFWSVPVPYGLNIYPDAEDRSPLNTFDWPELDFKPRHDQQELLEVVYPYLKENYNCRINCPTSYGKSVIGIRLAQLLGVNCIVIVHNMSILKQFKSNAKEIFDIDCGWYHGNKRDLSKAVTLTTIQTLATRIDKLDDEFLSAFSLALWDEGHHMGAASYIKVMQKLKTKYRLGLTATWRRNDGLDPVYKHYLGLEVFKGKILGRTTTPTLYRPTIQTRLTIHDFMDWRGNINRAKLETKIAQEDNYNEWLISLLKQLADMGRKTVLTSERLAQIDLLYEGLEGYNVGVFAGKHNGVTLKEKDLTEAVKCDIILASVLKVKEGLDLEKFLGEEEYRKIQPLDTIIISSPTKDSEQQCGRIGRYNTGPDPLVIHPVLDNPFCQGRIRKCENIFYKPNNFKVIQNLEELDE